MVWLASLVIGAVITGAVVYRFKTNAKLSQIEYLVAAVGLGLAVFGLYALSSDVGPSLFPPAPFSVEWYKTHAEDRVRKVADCRFQYPEVKATLHCDPAEKAKEQIDREESDRQGDAVIKRR